jgi:hypothetical protein
MKNLYPFLYKQHLVFTLSDFFSIYSKSSTVLELEKIQFQMISDHKAINNTEIRLLTVTGFKLPILLEFESNTIDSSLIKQWVSLVFDLFGIVIIDQGVTEKTAYINQIKQSLNAGKITLKRENNEATSWFNLHLDSQLDQYLYQNIIPIHHPRLSLTASKLFLHDITLKEEEFAQIANHDILMLGFISDNPHFRIHNNKNSYPVKLSQNQELCLASTNIAYIKPSSKQIILSFEFGYLIGPSLKAAHFKEHPETVTLPNLPVNIEVTIFANNKHMGSGLFFIKSDALFFKLLCVS